MSNAGSIATWGKYGSVTADSPATWGRIYLEVEEVAPPERRRQPRVIGIPYWFFDDDDEVLIELD